MSTSLIRVASERHQQLKVLAQHEDTSVSEVVGRLVKAEIERLNLSSAVKLGKWLDACQLEDGTVFVSGVGIGTHEWTPLVALSVADTLERLASGTSTGGLFDIDAGLSMDRVGMAVRIRDLITGERRSLSLPIACELVELLRELATTKH